jgi:hypothetical protein
LMFTIKMTCGVRQTKASFLLPKIFVSSVRLRIDTCLGADTMKRDFQ